VPASDGAFLVAFGDTLGDSSGHDVRALHEWLRDDPPMALVDLHPAYATLLVRYDPLRCDPEVLAAELYRRASTVSGRPTPSARTFEIPVRYGGADGPDLADVARAAGITSDEFAARHAAADYEVRFLGFLPGFPYLAGLPRLLHAPRRGTPRAHVPAGSVAIAGAQAGIYPVASPAGWNVIGRTEFVLFDAERENPATLAGGDRVRFRIVTVGS
jgi:KipI family sensor histidine kinase inhibitor